METLEVDPTDSFVRGRANEPTPLLDGRPGGDEPAGTPGDLPGCSRPVDLNEAVTNLFNPLAAPDVLRRELLGTSQVREGLTVVAVPESLLGGLEVPNERLVPGEPEAAFTPRLIDPTLPTTGRTGPSE